MKRKKILVLNLTRMGDLIQTTPLVEGLKEADPSCEITMAVNVGFVKITDFLPNIDAVKPFDIAPLRPENPADFSALKAFRHLDSFVSDLQKVEYDVLINLTHSFSSGMIGKLLGIADTRGVCLTDDGFRAVHNSWLMYFSSVLAFRHYNSFNLVDIYQLGGGVRPKARKLTINMEIPETEARQFLTGLGVGENETVIGIQAGSSMRERRWPPTNFARTADILSEKYNARIVFFGVASEKDLVDEVVSKMKLKDRALNIAGKTSLPQLLGLVKRCSLLVTNDTATMHIAASVDTPIVALFLVHAYGVETGPYCENAVILEPVISCFPCLHHTKCPHYACLAYIMPEQAVKAAEIVTALRKGEPITADPALFEQSFGDPSMKVRISRTLFDELGFFDSRPVFKKQATEREVLARMYRHVFLRKEAGGLSPERLIRYFSETHLPFPPAETAAWAEKERGVFDKLGQMAAKGAAVIIKARKDYKAGKMEKMKQYASELAETDHRMDLHALAHPELMPIVKMFAVGRGNMAEAPVEAMLERTKILYTEVEEASASMVELLGVLTAGVGPTGVK